MQSSGGVEGYYLPADSYLIKQNLTNLLVSRKDDSEFKDLLRYLTHCYYSIIKY